MRTTVTIDAPTLDEVMRLTKCRSRSAAIRMALDDYVRAKRTGELLKMRGQLQIDDDWEELRLAETVERSP